MWFQSERFCLKKLQWFAEKHLNGNNVSTVKKRVDDYIIENTFLSQSDVAEWL